VASSEPPGIQSVAGLLGPVISSAALAANLPPGPTGATGAIGPQGATGNTGGAASLGTIQAVYNVATNTPAISSGSGSQGQSYVVGTAGTASPAIDGITTLNVGDVLVRGATTWGRVPFVQPAAFMAASVILPGSSVVPIDLLLDAQGRVLQASSLSTLYQATAAGLLAAPTGTDLVTVNTTIATETATRAALIQTSAPVIPNQPETLAEVVLDSQGRVVEARGVSGTAYLPASIGLDAVVTQSQTPVKYQAGSVYVPGVGYVAAVTLDTQGRVTDALLPSGQSYAATTAGLAATATVTNPLHFDVVIYGGTIGGLMAAVRAKAQYGLRVCILEPTANFGGASAAVGLSVADLPATAGQIAGDTLNTFFNAIAALEGSNNWRYAFQPKNGQQIANSIAATYADLALTKVQINGPADVLISPGQSGVTILGIVTRAGIVTGTQFIDASYECDLGLAALGLSFFTLGRESTATYGESAAGFVAASSGEYTVVNNTYYPTIPDGLETGGQADSFVQSMGPRGVISRASNAIPFPKPSGYNSQDFIIALQILAANGKTLFARAGNYTSANVYFQGTLQNNKIGFNGADLPNIGSLYCAGNWTTRQAYVDKVMYYYTGTLYAIQSDPIGATYVPALQADSQGAGFAADEFIGSSYGTGVPMWAYIRESYRFTGAAYVLTQANTTGSGVAVSDPVCTYNYAQDFHNGQLYAVSGTTTIIRSEGFPALSGNAPVVPMSARTMMSPAGSGSPNLLIPVCFGASHIAWGPLRLEPNFGMMGEGAGVIASLAAIYGTPVQHFNYATVAAALVARGSIL
jgi:hypothetical protein